MAMAMVNNNDPVTSQVLRPLFEAAATNTSGNLKEVEDALKTLEIQPGFHYSLLVNLHRLLGLSGKWDLNGFYVESPVPRTLIPIGMYVPYHV